MKIKYLTLMIASLLFAFGAKCQNQIYFENFEGATNSFTINDTGFGSNSGNNKWIVDSNYFARAGYPNTKSEDSTYGGTISYAPYGHYLHIYDSASGYLNDMYNPNDSSTRFAHMTTGICTKALTNIYFHFFYLCPTVSSYGLVYYSIDGGPWTNAGDTLRGREKWQYATINKVVFSNKEDVRFGFMWHNNNSTSTKDTTSLGIDDASIVGTYDSVAHPITCTFTTQYSDSCLGGNAYIWVSATFNDSTCDANWDFDVSNVSGNFSPPIVAYTYVIGPTYGNDIYDYFLYASIPTAYVTPGRCYKVRLSRLSYPYISFTDSVCFPLDTCPGGITTLQPPSSLGDTMCAGSVIDIPFFSSGIYSTYNEYYAQLIDSNTVNHTAKIDTIGHLVSNVAYPYPPGDISGLVPLTAPAGCNYYVKVVCSTGNRPSTLWGPFCIQHCDIFTNNQVSIQACLKSCAKQPQGDYDTITYNIHKYDSLAHYYTGNKFEVQLISFMTYPTSFTVINTGLLGVKVDTTRGKIYLHVPCPDTLFANGINPGVYYMRIIADSSNYPDSALGSLVYVTIGEPADSMYLTLGSTGPFCAGSTIYVYTNPDDEYSPYNSTYTWWVTDKRNGRYEFPNYPYGELAFYNNGGDTMVISCQENNNGCLGNMAILPDTIVILGYPNITKTGPLNLCLDDTGTYSIPFSNNTDYVWKISAASHTDTANNVLKVKFDTTGTYRISVTALNACFTDSAYWSVKVIEPPKPVITGAATFCGPHTDTLKVSGGSSYLWNTGSHKTSIVVKPSTDTTYWVKVSNAGCSLYDTVKITVKPLPVVNVAYCVGDSVIMNASGAVYYTWAPTGGLSSDTGANVKANLSAIQTFTIIGIGSDGCKDTVNLTVNPFLKSDTISSAVAINPGQSVQLKVNGGTSWLWSPSSGLSSDSAQNPVASPTITTVYTVIIRNSNGCKIVDTVTVDVNSNCSLFIPDAFTPNNPTGHNTILYVRCECPLNTFDFIVFDRWGNKVFDSGDDQTKGWDGSYKGEPMSTGTYVYYVSGKTPDGKTLTKKGNVALVR